MAGKVPVLSSVELSQQIHEKRDQPGFLRAARMLMAKSVIEGTAKQGPEENSPHFRILDAAAFGEYKQRSREVFRQKAQLEPSVRILRRKHPLIVGNGWAKKNVSEIRAREKEVEALDRWLWSCRKTAELCTVPERCFEIWGNEHALRDDRQLQAIVRGCGISNGDLKMFSSEAREFKHCALSFPLSAPRLLVSENFSGYYALHRLVMQGEVPAKSIPANVLVFGGGTPVSAKGALGAFVKECLYADRYSRLYWGDVDGPGLEIQCEPSHE